MKKLLIAVILAGGALWAAQPADANSRVSVRLSYGYPNYYHYRAPTFYSNRYPSYRRIHRPYYTKGYFAPRHRFHKRYVTYGCY